MLAGPWSNITEEYKTHHDLLWIDQEEIYDEEQSFLTYKTISFVTAVCNILLILIRRNIGNYDGGTATKMNI